MIRPEQIPGLQAMKSINAFWVANPQTNRSNLRCFPHPSPRHSNSGSLDDVSHTWRPWKKSSALLRKERGWESAGQTLWDCVPVYGRRFGRLGGPWVFQVLANTQVMCGCWNETFFSNLLRILFRAQQAFPFSPVISKQSQRKNRLGTDPSEAETGNGPMVLNSPSERSHWLVSRSRLGFCGFADFSSFPWQRTWQGPAVIHGFMAALCSKD